VKQVPVKTVRFWCRTMRVDGSAVTVGTHASGGGESIAGGRASGMGASRMGFASGGGASPPASVASATALGASGVAATVPLPLPPQLAQTATRRAAIHARHSTSESSSSLDAQRDLAPAVGAPRSTHAHH
jgi:hypothetical protein